jgi:hypothetical protein
MRGQYLATVECKLFTPVISIIILIVPFCSYTFSLNSWNFHVVLFLTSADFRLNYFPLYHEGVSKRFRTESITKCTLTFGITRWGATQRVMAGKLTRLTHKIAIHLHLVAESCTICSSRSRRPVRKLLDHPRTTEIDPQGKLDRHWKEFYARNWLTHKSYVFLGGGGEVKWNYDPRKHLNSPIFPSSWEVCPSLTRIMVLHCLSAPPLIQWGRSQSVRHVVRMCGVLNLNGSLVWRLSPETFAYCKTNLQFLPTSTRGKVYSLPKFCQWNFYDIIRDSLLRWHGPLELVLTFPPRQIQRSPVPHLWKPGMSRDW